MSQPFVCPEEDPAGAVAEPSPSPGVADELPPLPRAGVAPTSAGSAAVGPAGDKGMLMIGVKRPIPSRDVTLHTELLINGKRVDRFATDTYKPIDQYLKKGDTRAGGVRRYQGD